MTKFLEKLRRWALIKLAAGNPVVLNLKLTRGLYLHSITKNALFENVHVKPDVLTSIVMGKESK